MRATSNKSDRIAPAPRQASRAGDAVAQGGPVADWQRLIEERYAGAFESEGMSRGEGGLRLLSLGIGWSALLAGYGVVGWMMFG